MEWKFTVKKQGVAWWNDMLSADGSLGRRFNHFQWFSVTDNFDKRQTNQDLLFMFSSYHGSISVGLQDADHEVKNLYSRTFGLFGHPDFFYIFYTE